ncbi:MAG: shikimate dehydrogenase [Rhodospirillales bacterium]|nr:shikimate dehydrogenase [Rhodospirillales bacterium]
MSKQIKCGVIGHPITHSKSPLIHNYWINTYGLNGIYEAIDVAPENLETGVKRLIDEGYKGFNVTVPHKETIMALCDKIDHNAQNIGAVNTVVIENGRLRGMNTDGYGFLHNIWDTDPNFDFEDKCAVVLGAGGATRAIVSALIGERIGKIILLNRTRERAENLAEDMGKVGNFITVEDWKNRHAVLTTADLLVNTTALGMQGQPVLEIDLGKLPVHALVNDIVYAPLDTDLLKAARVRGNKTVTGIGMLLHQARPAFKEWFGLLPGVTDELNELVLK